VEPGRGERLRFGAEPAERARERRGLSGRLLLEALLVKLRRKKRRRRETQKQEEDKKQ
jgi:hypothetical protein